MHGPSKKIFEADFFQNKLCIFPGPRIGLTMQLSHRAGKIPKEYQKKESTDSFLDAEKLDSFQLDF